MQVQSFYIIQQIKEDADRLNRKKWKTRMNNEKKNKLESKQKEPMKEEDGRKLRMVNEVA